MTFTFKKDPFFHRMENKLERGSLGGAKPGKRLRCEVTRVAWIEAGIERIKSKRKNRLTVSSGLGDIELSCSQA